LRRCAPDPVLLSDRELPTGQALAIAFSLVVPDLGQHGTEPFVGDDGALLDAGILVEEDPTREQSTGVPSLDVSVLVLVDKTAFTHERERFGTGLHEIHHALVVEGQIPRELALLLPGEDQSEVLVVTQWTVRVMRTLRLATESPVVVGAELQARGLIED
jgi:hypothetical protein